MDRWFDTKLPVSTRSTSCWTTRWAAAEWRRPESIRKERPMGNGPSKYSFRFRAPGIFTEEDPQPTTGRQLRPKTFNPQETQHALPHFRIDIRAGPGIGVASDCRPNQL